MAASWNRFRVISLVVLLAGCSGEDPQQAQFRSNEAELRRMLSTHAAYSYDMVLLKDAGDTYWYLPMQAIQSIDGRRIALRGGVLVTSGKGRGSPDWIADLFSRQRQRSALMTFEIQSGENQIKGAVEMTKEGQTIEAKEVLLFRQDRRPGAFAEPVEPLPSAWGFLRLKNG